MYVTVVMVFIIIVAIVTVVVETVMAIVVGERMGGVTIAIPFDS